MSALTGSPAWQALAAHKGRMADAHLRDLFAADPDRFARFSLRFEDLLLDYSKHRITAETMGLLVDLARHADVEGWRDRMFAGEKINTTEGRAVLHVALRNRSNRPIRVDGQDVMPDVNRVLAQLRGFTDRVRSGQWKGYTGQPIRSYLRRRGIGAVIPRRTNEARRGVRFDRVAYRERNRVERTINRLKQHRAIATRYEKLQETYHALLTIATILLWL